MALNPPLTGNDRLPKAITGEIFLMSRKGMGFSATIDGYGVEYAWLQTNLACTRGVASRIASQGVNWRWELAPLVLPLHVQDFTTRRLPRCGVYATVPLGFFCSAS
jgi:hypothetical protein